MMRNIACQSAFQLTLLLILLFSGAQWFGVPEGNACKRYKVDTGVTTFWNVTTHEKQTGSGFQCADFNTLCKGKGYTCLTHSHPWNGYQVNMGDLNDFDSDCLTCKKLDYHHYSIIFNAFIFCQVFNEFTARSIGNDWDVFSGVISNPIFLVVIVITIGCQIMLIEVGDEFLKTAPLTADQWLVTVALGAIGLPIGVLMRFIPMEEDPASFFDNSHAVVVAEPVNNKSGIEMSLKTSNDLV